MGQYTSIRLISRGQHECTYVALDSINSTIVTIRVMNEEAGNREISALTTLCMAPGVLQLENSLKLQTKKGIRYALVHKFAESRFSLSTLGSTMDEVSVTYVLQQVLLALIDVHAAGIVHCGVRASSLLIGSGGDIKLANFRTARTYSSKEAVATSDEGTLELNKSSSFPSDNCNSSKNFGPSPPMAPTGSPLYIPKWECTADSVASTAVDVWCVGMTALELSTGVLPQEGYLPGIRDFIEGPDAVYGGKAFSLEFKDFIKVCLRPDPRERGTCESLLSHSLFALHHRNSSISETGLPMGAEASICGKPHETGDRDREAPGLDFDLYLESLSGAEAQEQVSTSHLEESEVREVNESSETAAGLFQPAQGDPADVAQSPSYTNCGSSPNVPSLIACPESLLSMVHAQHQVGLILSAARNRDAAPGSMTNPAVVCDTWLPIEASRGSSIRCCNFNAPPACPSSDQEDEIFAIASLAEQSASAGDGKPLSPPARRRNPASPVATPPGMLRLNPPSGGNLFPGSLDSVPSVSYESKDLASDKGLKLRVGQSGSSNKLPGMVYIGPGDKDALFAEINYLTMPPGSPSDRINRQGSLDYLSEAPGGSPLPTLSRITTPVNPLSDLVNPDSSCHLLLIPAKTADSEVERLSKESLSATSGSTKESMDHQSVASFPVHRSLIGGVVSMSMPTPLGAIRSTPSADMEASAHGDSLDSWFEEEGKTQEEWSVRAEQRAALSKAHPSTLGESARGALLSQISGMESRSEMKYLNGSNSSYNKEKHDLMGSRHWVRLKGKPGMQQLMRASDESTPVLTTLAADSKMVAPKVKSRSGTVSKRAMRRRAGRDRKSGIKTTLACAQATSPASGADRGAKSKNSSQLLPFQSVLEVLRQHSISNSTLPHKLSGAFEEVIRPSLRTVVNSTVRTKAGDASAGIAEVDGDTDITSILLKALSEAVRIENMQNSEYSDGESSSPVHAGQGAAAALGERLARLLRPGTQVESNPSEVGNNSEGFEKTVMDLMMVLVTTMTALDVISDGDLTKKLLQSLMIKTLELTLRGEKGEKQDHQ